LTQDGKEFKFTAADQQCAGGYLDAVRTPIEQGMAIAISNWGYDWQSMSWLDADTGCKGLCNNFPNLVISNIQVHSVQGEEKEDAKYLI